MVLRDVLSNSQLVKKDPALWNYLSLFLIILKIFNFPWEDVFFGSHTLFDEKGYSSFFRGCLCLLYGTFLLEPIK
jgi:hypothetical protein